MKDQVTQRRGPLHRRTHALGTSALAALVFALVALTWSAAALARSGGNSAATITASFSDRCRDFAAHSSKDISHVVLDYADGRLVKDERITRPDYAIDGAAGGEIDVAIVKSGTTTKSFDCVRENRPPIARLEIKTPPVDQTLEHCFDFFSGGLECQQSAARTDWTGTSQIPDDSFGWGCGGLTDVSLCSFTISFRGTSSSDPDDDITSWSIDFGDGTSAQGNWSTDPPSEVAHSYGDRNSVSCVDFGPYATNICRLTLTVTDSAGQSDSETMVMGFIDQTPD